METDDRPEPEENIVEVYRCGNSMEADRAIVEVLEPGGIDAYLHDRTSHSLPAPASETGNIYVAVPEQQAPQARLLLRQALADDVLDPSEGEILETATA